MQLGVLADRLMTDGESLVGWADRKTIIASSFSLVAGMVFTLYLGTPFVTRTELASQTEHFNEEIGQIKLNATTLQEKVDRTTDQQSANTILMTQALAEMNTKIVQGMGDMNAKLAAMQTELDMMRRANGRGQRGFE